MTTKQAIERLLQDAAEADAGQAETVIHQRVKVRVIYWRKVFGKRVPYYEYQLPDHEDHYRHFWSFGLGKKETVRRLVDLLDPDTIAKKEKEQAEVEARIRAMHERDRAKRARLQPLRDGVAFDMAEHYNGLVKKYTHDGEFTEEEVSNVVKEEVAGWPKWGEKSGGGGTPNES